MSAHPSRPRIYPHAAARLRLIIAARAAVAGVLLAWAAAVPAAVELDARTAGRPT